MTEVGAAAQCSGTLEQQVRARVESLSYLPTSVAVAMKFVELGKNPEAEPSDYAKVISSDSSLSSKLLGLANSSWFGVRNRVTRPQMAVNLLGLGTVRTLALSYCLTGLHNELRLSPGESRMFWSASLCKAVAARRFVEGVDRKLAEEAFTAGLFQDFALPIMYSVARAEASRILQHPELDWRVRLQQERELFGLDHSEIGRLIAQKLDLPCVFVDAVAFHHNYDELRSLIGDGVMAGAVYVASLFPHVLNAWNLQDAEELSRFLATPARGKPADAKIFLELVQGEFNPLYAYFEEGGKPETTLVELLEAATREAADNTTRLVTTVHELLQQAANAGKEFHQILQRHSQLEEAATRDPLTGALNREAFQVRAGELLARANRYGTGLGVIYLDVDRFKVLNDTCGHATGDAALNAIVSCIRQSIRQTDLVARLGGDEFVAIVSDCSEQDGLGIVRRIVDTIAGQQLSHEQAGSTRVTLSAGFLWIPPKQPLYPLDKLVGIADQLMYKAKRAGGNCVCKGRTQHA